MNAKTVAGWLALAFVLWWMIQASTSSEHLVHNTGTFITTAASGLAHFFRSI